MALVHAVVGILLLTSHTVFLLRGLSLRHRGARPGTVDRIARAGSHVGLPLAAATGLIARLAAAPAGGAADGGSAAAGVTGKAAGGAMAGAGAMRAASTADAAAGAGALAAWHIVLGLLPFALILLFAPMRSLKRKIPWLLPAANLVLFAATAATGLLLL